MTIFDQTWEPAERLKTLRAVSLRPELAPSSGCVVSLAMGEPDFDTPAEVVEAAARALRDGHTHYADQQGLASLRAGIAARLPGPTVWTPTDVLVTHGATGALAALIMANVGPGDVVVIPEPAYSLYADLVILAGGRVRHVPLDRSLHWDLERLAAALPGARMIVFSNPSNPTGVVHSAQELRALGRLLNGTDTLVVTDEAYHRFVYTGFEFVSALEIEELAGRTAYVQTFSKTYAMTGWRLGYLVGPAAVVQAAAHVHRTMNGSVNTAVQFAGLRALDLNESAMAPMLAAYQSRRQLVMDELRTLPGAELVPPEGAFYGFLKYDLPNVPATVVVERLREHGVLVRAGSEYGPSGEGHVRISYAASEHDLRIGLGRIKECLTSASGRMASDEA